jgi:hypothetical protein
MSFTAIFPSIGYGSTNKPTKLSFLEYFYRNIKMSAKYDYVRADKFTPESRVNWKTVGKVTSWKKEEEGVVDRVTLALDSGHKVYIYFLSHQTFRVRFNPDPKAPYVTTESPATVEDRIEAYDLRVKEENGVLRMNTDFMEVRINLEKYALSVYRGSQLIHADPPDYNLVYIPRDLGEAVANFKMAPTNAQYYGFGEKGGASLDKRRVPKQHFYGQFGGKIYEKIPAALTFFNYDNFGYEVPDLTPDGKFIESLNEVINMTTDICPTTDNVHLMFALAAEIILFSRESQCYPRGSEGRGKRRDLETKTYLTIFAFCTLSCAY